MTAAKRIRWNCPNNKHPGILASTRPPLNSIERYCLACSTEAGYLIKRVAPALERKRADAAANSAAKAKAKREREARERERKKQAETERYVVEGVDLRDEMKKLLALKAFGGNQGRLVRRPPELVISRRSRYPRSRLGYAEPWANRITLATWPRLSLDSALTTLVHELTHIVVGAQPGARKWHGPLFQKTNKAALKEAYGVVEAYRPPDEDGEAWWYLDMAGLNRYVAAHRADKRGGDG